MLSKTRVAFLFFLFFFSFTVQAQIGYFLKIAFRNPEAIQLRLEKQLAKGEMNTDKLFFKSKDGKDSISVIAASAGRPCKECLDAFLAKRQQLEPYMDVQQELNKSIKEALKNDDIDMLDYLIELNVDINYDCECCFRRSPLLIALSYKRYASFFKLMKLGANPYAIDQNGKNALHMALMMHNKFDGVTGSALSKRTDTIIGILDTLLNRGVPIQQKDLQGFTPLILAGGDGDAEVFEHLRLKGAGVQLDDQAEVVSLLNNILSHNPYALGSKSKTLYEKVVDDYHIQFSKSLFDTRDFDGAYSILWAVSRDNYKAFDTIMKYKADVNVRDLQNKSALSYAVNNHNDYMCEKLLDAGAIVDVRKSKYKAAFESHTVLLEKFRKARRAQKKNGKHVN